MKKQDDEDEEGVQRGEGHPSPGKALMMSL